MPALQGLGFAARRRVPADGSLPPPSALQSYGSGMILDCGSEAAWHAFSSPVKKMRSRKLHYCTYLSPDSEPHPCLATVSTFTPSHMTSRSRPDLGVGCRAPVEQSHG